ncbi:MAG: type II toxin-antitoxin system VapC family toxin [Myxococcales bacterium]|nr:type II toxin-antitoxin system VapC family toxin [Myxococcales bacterium]
MDWSALPDGAQVLVDSAPLIYAFEGHPLGARFEGLFDEIAAGRLRARVTPVTVAEVVGGPLRHGRHGLAERYRLAMTTAPGWSLRALDGDLALLAARVRAEHGLRLPDAIQLATAIADCCDALVTHGRAFPRDAGVPVWGPPPDPVR